MSDVDVVAIGEALLRVTPTPSTGLAQATTLAMHVAGAELNVALDLAALGIGTRWISALPRSPLGERVARELRAGGVRTDGITWVDDARLGLFFVDPQRGPLAADVVYDRAGTAFARYASADPAHLAGARYALVSGLTLALGEPVTQAVEEFATAAEASGAGLCVDVNHRRRLWSAAQARAALVPLLARADLVVCSSPDAAEVLDLQAPPDEQLLALRETYAPQASLVVLTLGGDGAIASPRDGDVEQAAAVPTVAVDRFGTGDAFVAGLLWALLDGQPTGVALLSATTLAAVKRATPGDHVAVTAERLRELVADRPDAGVRR